MDNLAKVVEEMKLQLDEARKNIAAQQGQIERTQNELVLTRDAPQNQQVEAGINAYEKGPRIQKPSSFKGKGSISS